MPDRGSDTDPTPDANRVTPADDFTGDNKVVWERWSKKRTFVRALEGTYGELKDEGAFLSPEFPGGRFPRMIVAGFVGRLRGIFRLYRIVVGHPRGLRFER